MSARVSDRWRLTLPLLLPALGGVSYLYAYGAPFRLIAVNAGALALALMWIMLGRLPASRTARLIIAAATAIGMAAPLWLGPEVGGVTRWLPAGAVQLHSGTLLLPLLTVLCVHEQAWGPALLSVATAALALQPDAAVLAALGGASVVLAAAHRSVAFALVAAAALSLAAVTFNAGTLDPQIFTEGVLAHVAEHSVAQSMALGALLFAVPVGLFAAAPQACRLQAFALAALLSGLALAAAIAPFPFPLIGYGAAPIFGFGLALEAMAGITRSSPSVDVSQAIA